MKAYFERENLKETAKRTLREIRSRFAQASARGAHRGLLMFASLLMALNMTVLMLPYSPSASAAGTSVTKFDDLKTAVEALSPDEIEITLENDIECTGNLRPAEGKTVTIHGGGHTLSRASGFKTEPMIISDKEGTAFILDNVTLSAEGVSGVTQPLISIGDTSSVTLTNKSKLRGSDPTGAYGGVFISGHGVFDGGAGTVSVAALNAGDAVISGCGGAVYVKDEGELKNTSIYGCGTASGSVYVESGKVTSCVIKNSVFDSSSACGGGVYMRAGEIADCTVSGCSNGNGGGIYMKSGSVTGCTVDSCTAVSDGGGIYAQGGSISKTTIRNCKAGKRGGGLAVIRDKDDGTGTVNLSDTITITGCGAKADSEGNVSPNFYADSVFINGSKSDGYNSTPVDPVSENTPSVIKVPDCFVKTVYSGTYQTNHLADQSNIVTYTELPSSASDKTAAAINKANTDNSVAVGSRVFGGLFTIDSDAKLAQALNYQIKFTDDAEHAVSSGSSAGTSGTGSTEESPFKKKRFMYVVYDIDTAENGDKTASVKHTGKLTADPFGDLTIGMDFEPTDEDGNNETLAAVLYEYPNTCKIGSTEYPDLAKAIDAARSGDTITLLRDTETDATLEVNKNNLTFDGAGHTVWRSTGFADPVFDIKTLNNITFKDLTVTGKEFDSQFAETDPGSPDVSAPLVCCAGTLNLVNTTLCDNKNTSSSAGENDPRGGGVYLDGGCIAGDGNSFITGNTATNGGGVFTKKPSAEATIPFKVGGVEITGNTATKNGGGIFADDGLTLENVTVQNNSASEKGGGVYAAKDTDIGGELQINGNTCGSERSDYHLAIDTGKMTVTSPLSPGSIIGVKNCADTSTVSGSKVNYNVLALADGNRVTSLEGLDKCFFSDNDTGSSRKSFENYPDNTKISYRSTDTVSDRYTVNASAGENGRIAPSGEMVLPAGSHDFYITPDEGYVIDTVTVKPGTGAEVKLYSNDAPVDNNANGSVSIEDGKGKLTCNIQKATEITATFKKADGTFTVKTGKSGGNDKCTASADKDSVSYGESDAVSFSTGKDNLAYVLSDIEVDGKSIKTDSSKKKMSDYMDVTQGDDKSLNYTYKVNDIRSSKDVKGVFKEAYKKDSKTDSDNNITLSGDYIGTDSALSVRKIAQADQNYDAIYKLIESNLDAGYIIRRLSNVQGDYAIYDISLDSPTLEYPYRSDVELKLFAGTEHAGSDAYAYHITDLDGKKIDKSLKGKVDTDGYFTVKTDSLSPYAVIIPSGTTPSSTTTTTATPAAATPSSSITTASTTSTRISVSTTGTPTTGDSQPRAVWPLFVGSAVVAVISGVSITLTIKKKKEKAAER